MNELYATINFSKQKFILNGVDLISGDYNSTKIKFTFEDNQDKTKVIEIRPANSEDKNPTFMATITNNEVILTSKDDNEHNVTPFTTGGVYYMEISAYSNNSKLSTITKSFNVLEEQIILSDEIVSPYLPVFDELIEEIIKVTDEASNVNIDVTKQNNITTVTITNRDGVVKTVQILDGKDGTDGKDGEDGVGIESIEKISTSGLVDTYRITLTNNEHYDYEITNGNGIVSIEKTETSGNIDTYTITYSNGTTSTFTVTNSEVTEEEFEELQSQVNELSLYVNALPKVTGSGTNITLNDTAKCPMTMSLKPSATSQATSILPDGYTQVDYIESNGTQYIDTGEKATENTTFDITFYESTNTKAKIFGSRISVSSGAMALYFNSGDDFVINYGTQGITYTDDNRFVNNIVTIKTEIADNKYRFYLNNNFLTDFNKYTGSFLDQNMYLGSYNNNGTAVTTSGTIRIYKCKIYNNNLVKNFIPCYRNSDNEVGMYDLVNDVFYTNAGTGSFTYGAVVSIPNPDYPQDIHTVSGNNTITISNSDNTESQTLPLNLGTIELCKIGTYEDYFYKNSDKWYLKKNVLKTSDVIGSLSKTISDMASNATVYSYCGGTVSGTTITYSSALTVENEIYYPTTTPTNTEITDTTLIGELEAIYNKATSYQDQTNITQVNNDLPFVITASAIYDLSNLLN